MKELLAEYECTVCGERVYSPHVSSDVKTCINCEFDSLEGVGMIWMDTQIRDTIDDY